MRYRLPPPKYHPAWGRPAQPGAKAVAAMKGHVLAQGEAVATWSLDPKLPKAAK